MFIASQKRKENIAEYLLYMWQVEDIIRANNLDIETIKTNWIDRFNLETAERNKMIEWYESLIDMMRSENVIQSGHLQINRNIISELVRLHQTLLNDNRFATYSAEFYKTLPFIVELRAKAGDNPVGELETCFNALYGMLLMRIQSKEITADTQRALQQISTFISILAAYFKLDDEDKLFNNDENTENPC